MIPGTGQIELFTGHKADITLVKFKTGGVCYIKNPDIEGKPNQQLQSGALFNEVGLEYSSQSIQTHTETR